MDQEVQQALNRMTFHIRSLETRTTLLRDEMKASLRRQDEAILALRREMRRVTGRMHREIGRQTAAFDQWSAGASEEMQEFRQAMGIVADFLTRRMTSIEDRLDAVERKLAG